MSELEEVIRFENVSKRYRLHDVETFKEFVPSVLRKRPSEETFWAVKDLSFSIHRGETVGFVGHNGSGKSTSLRMIAGVTGPTKGKVYVAGRVAPLLQLGAGFHPDLTGRENIFLNGCILGMTDKEIRESISEIVEFAEIERFLDTPVKHYSSGMYLRLGFSVAINCKPDILIVDEALAVGDIGFQEKCYQRIRKMQSSGVTIVFVSHSPGMVRDYCDRVIMLNHGEKVTEGTPDEVLPLYENSMAHVEPAQQATAEQEPVPEETPTPASV